ncbi:hypothetical protein Taro_023003 [Colocasia esculenta]|uniref:Stress-related protein n=1 Tax=Colocasia esculenta TaxID=4460 RepID=A0A843UW36_COLES|nr:hypothetical protein [Colocasia esculenta]
MAESGEELQQTQEGQAQGQAQQKLKYLDFVHLAAVRAVVCLSRLYGYAKESSGPLKPGVETVEGIVRSVISPVYDKFHDVPYELLKFVDRKVDESLSELDRRLPSAVKEASSQAYTAAQRAPEVARSVAGEVQRAGVVGTAVDLAKGVATRCKPTAKQLYARYEPVAEQYAAATWRALNRLPLFPQAAHVVVPTAAHLSGKYNSAVCYGAEKGYAVAAYLPLVPTERIAKVFGSDGGEAAAAAAQ